MICSQNPLKGYRPRREGSNQAGKAPASKAELAARAHSAAAGDGHADRSQGIQVCGPDAPRKKGRAPKLQLEEELKIIACQWIKLVRSNKLPTTCPMIKEMVNRLLEGSVLQEHFASTNGQVTDWWYYSFRDRWQGVLGETYLKKHEIQHKQ